MEKMKSGFGNVINKTKTVASRAEQKVMQKVGKAEGTVDISYNQEKYILIISLFKRFLIFFFFLFKIQRAFF